MTPRRIALAVWDFVVGDDWRLALAAVVAIGLTAVVCALGPSAWWLAPVIALAALRWSLRGVAPASRPSPDGRSDPTAKAGGPAADQPGVQSPPK
jgi:hypothetical protein